MTTIDGGLLVLKSLSDYNRAKKLRWFGLDKTIPRLQNDIKEGGYKYHMNDVNATFGLIQLNYLEENVNKYIDNGLFFDEQLTFNFLIGSIMVLFSIILVMSSGTKKD